MDTRLDDLPTLTPKQTAFVSALLEGKTAADAYRSAYNCENMSPGAIAVEASRLRRCPKISLCLRHYQRIGFDQARITAENHLAELARAREEAIAHVKSALAFKRNTIAVRLLASTRSSLASSWQ
jgi:phage terminase small subunit